MRTHITAALVALATLQAAAANALTYAINTTSSPCTGCTASLSGGVYTVNLGTGTYTVSGTATGVASFNETTFTVGGASGISAANPLIETFNQAGNTVTISYTSSAISLSALPAVLTLSLDGFFKINGAGTYNVSADSFTISPVGLAAVFIQSGNSGVTVIPIPAGLPLFATGLVGLGFLARRRLPA
jgi:hypothetical protein